MKEIPEWLASYFIKPCEYCGETYRIGLSPDGNRITKHYCPNSQCPGTIAQKIVFMADLLSVSGVGFATALNIVKTYDIKHHLEVLKLWGIKQEISLYTFMRLCCINGIDTGWKDTVANVKTLDGILALNIVPEEEKEFIRENVQYVNLKTEEEVFKYEPVWTGLVMITGDIPGFMKRREDFITSLNYMFEGYVRISYSNSKRKTGVSYLIREANSPITGKVTLAKQCGIPEVTSKEFMTILFRAVYERIGEKIHDLKAFH